MRANEFTQQYIEEGDYFDIELGQELCLSTYVKECFEDGIVLEADAKTLEFLDRHGLLEDVALTEAEYQGRKVQLGKPMKGDVKKSKVYVKGPKGNVVKVNFGDKKMRIKKNIPGRRKNFRARHNCDNPGPRWKARYWSCRAW